MSGAIGRGGLNAAGVVGVVGVVALAALTAAGCGGGGGDRPCTRASGTICTIAGTGIAGDGEDGRVALTTNLYLPQDVTIGPDGSAFIVDWNNHRIRALGSDGTLRIVAGVGELGLMSDDPSSDRLNHPTNVAFNPEGQLVIAAWHNSRIKAVPDLTTGETVNTCGNGLRAFAGDGGPAPDAALNLPVAIVYDAAGDLIISDQANQRIRKVDHETDIIRTIAGTGVVCPIGAVCPIGDGGPALEASFAFPGGQAARPGGRIDIDAQGNLYVADTSNCRLRKIDTAGIITTVAGTGQPGFSGDGGPATEADLSRLTDVAAGPDGTLYIADNENSCIRAVRPDGTIATVAGTCGKSGFSGDGGPPERAMLDRPYGVALDAAGNLYIADTHNNRIRVVYH